MAGNTEDAASDPAFLDDFYAECDEHLTEIRRALLRLGEAPRKPEEQAAVWELLFRQMHSLKGILGMAGLGGPERLAHQTEDYLRSLVRQQAPIREESIDALVTVAQVLEQVLSAHRQHQPLPDVAPVLERISRLPHPSAQSSVASELGPEVEATSGKPAHTQSFDPGGRRVWRFLFTPSPELNQRGIDINTVRARLLAMGEILRSTPKVESGGAIAFEFLVATARELPSLHEWDQEGLRVYPVEAGEQPAADASKSAASRSSESSAPLGSPSVAPSHIVRVDLERLDELMRAMGEMIVNRARLEETLGTISGVLPVEQARALQEINYSFARELRRLRDGLMRVRLVPISEAFERMSLVVRDLAREQGRRIRLTLRGQETKIDKYVVERLKEPLLHLVRNAASHGFGAPEQRAAREKPDALTISLRASTIGESVVIVVQDDGEGIDVAKVRERARQVGLAVPEHLTPTDLLDLLCEAGFSTREEADLGAGRGVGMAVVKKTVMDLGGEISLQTEPGRGTTFTLRLPLTLAIADALLIVVGGQRFALPHTGLHEILTVRSSGIQRFEASEFIHYREGILPLVRLARLFGLDEVSPMECPVLVVGYDRQRVGVVVDRVLGQREVMIRTLSDPLFRIPAVSGATELGDGRPVLILDPLGLIRTARNHPASRGWKGPVEPLKVA